MCLRAGFALAILILLSNILTPLLGGLWVNRAHVQEEAQEHLSTQLQLLLSALKDGETGQRGFAISGRDDFLSPLFQGYAEVDRQLAILRVGLADDRQLQSMLPELTALIQELGRVAGRQGAVPTRAVLGDPPGAAALRRG